MQKAEMRTLLAFTRGRSPGGMVVDNRWAYFAFILNWYAPEGADSHTVEKFFAAIHEALARVRDALS